MLVSTTETLQGHNVKEMYGLVYGAAALSKNKFSAGISNWLSSFGGRSSMYYKLASEARAAAIADLAASAEALGANAVLAVRLNTATVALPDGSDAIMVEAYGTAVLLD